MATQAEDRGSPSGDGAGAAPDVVDTWAEASAGAPLIVREGLRELLDLAVLPEVERIDAGHSNVTFAVRVDQASWILRRPPRPPFAPTAHDVLREHRFLTALRGQPVRTPVPALACEDPAVIGAPFYLMESLDGHVAHHGLPAALDCAEERRRIAEELIDALVELHAVDPACVGLGDPARGAAYLERQLDLWEAQWERRRTRAIPALDEVTRRLRRSLPGSPPAAIVHGDYKLDNVMFAPGAPARLIAILDWEMATIGDPLADVGYLTATWMDSDDPSDRLAGLSTVTAQAGFPSRAELAQRYQERSGRSLDNLSWYQALALWKLAILLEASYRRFLDGTATDEFFRGLEQGVPRIAEEALAVSADVR